MALQDWSKGESITAAKLNEQVRAINQGVVSGGPDTLIQNLKVGGTNVSSAKKVSGVNAAIIGKIAIAGPDAEADYTDYRYWVQLTENNTIAANQLITDELNLLNVPADLPDGERIVTAYNLSDYAEASHSLTEDTAVMLMRLCIDMPQEAGLTRQWRWFIVGGTGGGLPVPQYQYMTMQAVSQNQLGADWTRAHDLI